MKELLFFTLFVGFNFPVCKGQDPLIVRSGETRRIRTDDSKMFVSKLIMEDNSTIRINSNVRVWDFTALDAKIGKNCKIIGIGNGGDSGADGVDNSKAKVGECQKGLDGGDGIDGAHGENGVDINMTLGINTLGSLEVDLRGGRGGHGGNGGNGGQGGRGDCSLNDLCNGGVGGRAGNGGFAGSGGDGGDFTLKYWVIKTGANTPSIPSTESNIIGIKILNQHGGGGRGGINGKVGKGGEGRDCSSPIENREPGGKGKKGVSRPSGKPGLDGKYSATPVPNPVSKD